MKKKNLLLIAVCFFTLTITSSSCKVSRLHDLEPISSDPGDGGGGGGTNPPPYVETADITELRTYFANTAGVDVNQVTYDPNSDTFTRGGTTDVVSHTDLSDYYFHSRLNSSN